jgi:hypothetical protein
MAGLNFNFSEIEVRRDKMEEFIEYGGFMIVSFDTIKYIQ